MCLPYVVSVINMVEWETESYLGDGWMDGWMDRQTDRWMDGWAMNAWFNESVLLQPQLTTKLSPFTKTDVREKHSIPYYVSERKEEDSLTMTSDHVLDGCFHLLWFHIHEVVYPTIKLQLLAWTYILLTYSILNSFTELFVNHLTFGIVLVVR